MAGSKSRKYSRPSRERSPGEPDPFALSRELATKLLEQLNKIADDPSLADESLLLGKNDGLIDGFNSLSAALARVLDRDPDRFDDASPETNRVVPDDQQIRQRIAAELDRLFARGGARSDTTGDRADTGGPAETASYVEGVESAARPDAA